MLAVIGWMLLRSHMHREKISLFFENSDLGTAVKGSNATIDLLFAL
jgi:hypothetical protein